MIHNKIILGWLITAAGLASAIFLAIGKVNPARTQADSLSSNVLQETATRTRVPTVTGWPTHTSTPTLIRLPPGTLTFTQTPTSQPGEPMLIDPEDGALMPPPIPPNEWFFSWTARNGPCYCYISIFRPDGTIIDREIQYANLNPLYQFHYQDPNFPKNSMGWWYWMVSIACPMGHNPSEWRAFLVQAVVVQVHEIYIPNVIK